MKWLLRCLIVAGVLGFGLFVYVAWPRPIPRPPATPSPNGYDDFLQAAESIVRGANVDPGAASADKLRELVRANLGTLELVRVGLGRECAVPLEYSQQHVAIGLERAQQMREVGRLLVAEGRLAEQEGRPADAVRSYLDVIRFGQEMCRGGLVIDQAIGSVIEGSYGIAPLRGLRSQLDSPSCEKLIDELQSLDRRREPFEDVAAREHASQDAQIVQLGFSARLSRGRLKALAQPAEDQAQRKYRSIQTELRVLVIELAIQRHVAERGSPPGSLDDLAPRYLAVVPVDPESGRPFTYQLDAGGPYRVGPAADDSAGDSDSRR